jgi:hypothetical protein
MLSELGADIGHGPRGIPRAIEQPIDAALQPDPQGIEDRREYQHDDRGLHHSPPAARARSSTVISPRYPAITMADKSK